MSSRRINRRGIPWLFLLHVLLVPGGFVLTVEARTLSARPENYANVVRDLKPGDVLSLAPGRYAQGLRVHGLQGTAAAPITIQGPIRGAPAILVARPGANTVSIVDAAHVVIRNLVLDGRGLAVDAVKAEGHARFAHHITLENLRIVGHGDHQQTVGISTKCPAWGWVIRGNSILSAGTGIYLGGSDGSAPFFDGVIEDNAIVDPLGYALQIKHQHGRPELGGSDQPALTIIRRNRFVKTARGSTGELARPNLLVGHFPLEGRGAKDLYAIYGNVFFDNPTGEPLFQGEGNIALYNNLLVNLHGDAVRIQPHQHRPRTISVFHNTILATGTGISLVGGEPGFPRFVGGNAVFSASPLQVADADLGNLTGPLADAGRYLEAPFLTGSAANFGPRASAVGKGPSLPAGAERLPDVRRDFRDLMRLAPGFGACIASEGPARRACR